MDALSIDVFVLNFNGRHLLTATLPSVVEAARRAGPSCRVIVVDNASSDGSRDLVARFDSTIGWRDQLNHGLCSFNAVAAQSEADFLVLLNNDLRLDRDAIDALVRPLARQHATLDGHAEPIWMTAALCWRWDGMSYDGQRTAVGWRRGLVQATSLYPGHEPHIGSAGETASAGAAIAVDRRVFCALGGFDPRYLPGRLEDLDLAWRAFQAGYVARYVPQAVAFHLGQGSFAPALGQYGCDALALRNTLLFQWKNLRGVRWRLRAAAGIALRLLAEPLRAFGQPSARRWALTRALFDAWRTHRRQPRKTPCPTTDRQREAEFFRRYSPGAMRRAGAKAQRTSVVGSKESSGGHKAQARPVTTNVRSGKVLATPDFEFATREVA